MTAPDLRPDEISAAPPTVGDAGFLYHLIAYLVTPLFGLFLLWRGLRDRRYWQGFGERFGFASRSTRPSIWLHAASVGEVQAAVALVRELHARFPTYALVMTTFTVTGRDHARALFKDEVQVQFLPFDLRGSARRFCDRIRPQFVVFFETELWPNLYRECGRRQVPLVIANARLSPRSVTRYRKFHGIFERTLANARLIAAQSEADAERFRSLGAVPAVVRTVGNIKFDFVLKPDVVERGERLRKIYAGARPVWIAGSTHGGEEELILEAHRHVQVIHPTALLILVPRHPDRASQIVALLNREGMQFARRSEDVTCRATTQVLLVDTLGELLDFYAASDIAFVGGSLVPIGGHNLLEPAALGLPVLTGPHNSNGAAVAQMLIERGGLEIVHSVSELASKVVQWLADSEERERIGGLARMAVQDNRGSLARLVDLIRLEVYSL